MNKHFVIFVLCVIFLGAPLAAQDFPPVRVFGGYQYTRIGGPGGVNTNGWNAAVTVDVNRWLGVKADFSGAYKSAGEVGAQAHTYTFGPVLSRRGERITPYVHALFGGFRASAGFRGLGASTNGVAMMLGGGADARISGRVSVRIVQFDWITWNAQGVTEKKNARISTGLVFKF
ncbi:MAG: hypothetical protein EHM23_21765 [Acidobacteria bacterium]|nr:MAG: hypothetical protein EHM23_21765 [Acidobacteriota bacterium]